MTYIVRILFGWFLILLSPLTFAATANGTMSVTASVVNTCTIGASNVLAFGAYTGAVNTATGSFQLTCTNGDAYDTALDIGKGQGASFTNRILTTSEEGTSGTLNYNIYTTSALSTVWGDGTASTATVPGTGTGASQTIAVYGQIPAGQTTAVAGNYTDTVNITVTF